MSEVETGMSSTDEESYDFSNDGIQPVEKVWTITGIAEDVKDNGKQLVVTFEAPEEPFPHIERYWLEHSNEDAQRIGRGQLKQLAIKATGQPKFTKSTLVGARVTATLAEDSQGYARLKKFKPAKDEAGVE